MAKEQRKYAQHASTRIRDHFTKRPRVIACDTTDFGDLVQERGCVLGTSYEYKGDERL